MPLGPITIACLAGAVVFAFLRAREEQEARRNMTVEEPAGEARRPRLSEPKPRYTGEGEEHRRRAKRYRLLFAVFALGALAAAWMGV